MMPRDYVEELALIEMSKLQRKTWEHILLDAGIEAEEAERIAALAAEDRAAEMNLGRIAA